MAYYPHLKDLREDRDLKQKDIAKLLFITQQQYSLYEKGYREIPTTALITLAKFYNTSVDYILGLTDNPKRN
ncbi:MAG: helix-turn-helix transcriptional regulator [Ruminococcaceae bacterium]|nr:helix-turn-helix transcriptional regulator [Oscillospiraceae bacterium]